MKKFKYSVVIPINTDVYSSNILKRLHEIYTSTNIIVCIMGKKHEEVEELLEKDKILKILKIETDNFNYSFCVNFALKDMLDSGDFEKDEIVAISESTLAFSMVQLDQTFKDFDFDKKFLTVDILKDSEEEPFCFETKRLMLSIKHQIQRIEKTAEKSIQIPITTLDILVNKINGLEEKININLSRLQLIEQLSNFGLEKVNADSFGLELMDNTFLEEEIIDAIGIMNILKNSKKDLEFIQNNYGTGIGVIKKNMIFKNDEIEGKPKITYIKNKKKKNKSLRFIPVQTENDEYWDIDENHRKKNILDVERINMTNSLETRKRKKRIRLSKKPQNPPVSVTNKNNINKEIQKPILFLMNNDIPTIATVSIAINKLYEDYGKINLLLNTKNINYYKILGTKMIGDVYDISDVHQCRISLDKFNTIIRSRDCRIPIPMKYEFKTIACVDDDLVKANTKDFVKDSEIKPYCYFPRSKKVLSRNTVAICTSFDLHNKKLNPNFINIYENIIKKLSSKRIPLILINMRYEKSFLKNKKFSMEKHINSEPSSDILDVLGMVKQCIHVITPQKSNTFWASFMLNKSTSVFRSNNEQNIIDNKYGNFNFYSLDKNFDIDGYVEAICTKIYQ
jgi:predicted transcriptional regulator